MLPIRHIFLLMTCCCIFYQQQGHGQNNQDIKLSELKAPSAPAFTILGVQPNDISRPKDFNSLELSLLNSISNNNNLSLPKDFALEATPFWLRDRNITFSQLESNTDLFSTLWQTLSISLATSQRNNFIDSTQKVSQIGLGFRSYLAKGRLANASNVSNAVNKISNTTTAILNFVEILNLSKRYIDHHPTTVKNLSVTDYRKLLTDLLQFPFVKLKAVAKADTIAGAKADTRAGKQTDTKVDTKAGKQTDTKVDTKADKKAEPKVDDANHKSDSTRAERILEKVKASKDITREFIKIYLDVATPYINQSIILDENDAKKVLDELVKEIEKSYNNNKEFSAKVDEIRDYREKRVGWLLEIAGATGLETPKPGIRDIGVSKAGLWLTLTNRPEKVIGFEWILLARLITEDSEIRRAKNYDGGTRIVYDNGKIFLSGESLIRTEELVNSRNIVNGAVFKESVTSTYFRWGFNVGYRINQNIVVQGSIAKSLNSDLIYRGGYVSLLGINFGFGQPVLIPNPNTTP
jgi:hypothetical protein